MIFLPINASYLWPDFAKKAGVADARVMEIQANQRTNLCPASPFFSRNRSAASMFRATRDRWCSVEKGFSGGMLYPPRSSSVSMAIAKSGHTVSHSPQPVQRRISSSSGKT
jgi:hypothetical protein